MIRRITFLDPPADCLAWTAAPADERDPFPTFTGWVLPTPGLISRLAA